MTDIEFSEIRYPGIPINCIVFGWVNLAMVKILMLILGATTVQALVIVMGLIAFTSLISTLSGPEASWSRPIEPPDHTV